MVTPHTLFVEKTSPFATEAQHLLHDLREALTLAELSSLRLLNRYDIFGISPAEFQAASATILSEPQTDTTSTTLGISAHEIAFAYSYLPGQFDQRADSAAQAIQILTGKEKPQVTSSRIVILSGNLSAPALQAIKSYIINPVDSHEVPPTDFIPHAKLTPPEDIAILAHFLTDSPSSIRKDMSLAMSEADITFTQDYFKNQENRPPSLTEIRMLDTYWSDHCRHTTFLTAIEEITFAPGTQVIEETYGIYRSIREKLGRDQKPVTLMDIALIGMRELKASGELDNLEVSEEINAASIVVKVKISNPTSQKDSVAEPPHPTSAHENSFEEEWLIQFKNETHNHPTEIEPFGGAATCLGGCIRDPLSGRSYVYQAMRVTGAANPLTPFSETLPGKLPQKKICQVAAKGYSSYGNQIGLATGQVAEIYHPGYLAKRLEIGAVVAAAPRSNVFRGSPAPGDVIMLIGGRTGRDGVGGATGSSKEHTHTALENSAEVQKGDAPTERKIQRLFRNPELTRKIKICNDFGAGGVSVAIGEIAPSLVIHLDAIPKKYDGLDGTELAISESQERMAVCIHPSEIDYFIAESDRENLECVHVADVTDSGRLIMTWRGKTIVNLSRAFLDTNGVQQSAAVHVEAPKPVPSNDHRPLLTDHLSSLNICSQKGLGEMFDASVGANTILWPFGGTHQITPPDAMVAKLPLLHGETDHATYMSWGFDPHLSEKSPFLGAAYAVTQSVCKAVAAGARLTDIRLTLQEYFPRLGTDPKRWGLPFAALLGAFRAQHELRLAAIGGKDSMSGTFNELDVPPTLVSFALAPGLASLAISPEFKHTGSTVSLVEIPALASGLPDFPTIISTAAAIHRLNQSGKLLAVHHIGTPGIAAALTKMALGNRIGFIPTDHLHHADLFSPKYFSFLIEHLEPIGSELLHSSEIGKTSPEPTLSIGTESHTLAALQAAFESTLEPIYPTIPESPQKHPTPPIPPQKTLPLHRPSSTSASPPKVLIPTFPGTNSEYDSARAFQRVGAQTHIEVFRNLTASHIEQSIAALAKHISSSQILFIPGGFSAGDEPDGSAKFIATILRNPRISDAISDLLENRDGLILGICNGFQALIKTGLATHGKVIETAADSPTLIHNDISRHISQYVRTRIANNSSPWLSGMEIGQIHTVPVSHGEGKFFAPPEVITALLENGQIATQYCDLSGNPTMDHPFNPNGSLAAIEGITSPCGKILGKMAHSERWSENVAKNLPEVSNQSIFANGVAYFSA